MSSPSIAPTTPSDSRMSSKYQHFRSCFPPLLYSQIPEIATKARSTMQATSVALFPLHTDIGPKPLFIPSSASCSGCPMLEKQHMVTSLLSSLFTAQANAARSSFMEGRVHLERLLWFSAPSWKFSKLSETLKNTLVD